MSAAIKVFNISKRYRLGLTHAGSVRELVNGTLHRILRGKSKSPTPAMADTTRIDGDSYFWALRDVEFEIQPGEVVGIIGRNGAGKSTLLKLLSRITSPTSGRIELRGRVASLLEVGTGFHPELTGRENVYMNGTILGMNKREIDAQFDAIVDFSGVEKFIDTPVKRYSSGMTVRLGFAVAAHLDPEILIVDEVLAVGDVEFQRRCLSRMQSVADSGKTVLFVSHNLASIRSLTTRTVVLSQGNLIFDGPTDEGIAKYVTENLPRDSTRICIKDLPRPFGGLDRSLEFVDLQLEVLSVNRLIESEAPLRLAVTIKCQRESANFIIGMTIFSDDKTVIGSMFTSATSAPPVGSIEVFNFDANLPLAPGRYHCSISISDAKSEGKRLHDSLAEVLPFAVELPVTDVRGWNPAWGAIRLPSLIRA